eukprot:TRINITY_DN1020_c0_g1_i1.p1 TRINITY_DN1020_c0_g1~~TRINITY_DN1020_c0_g1_i1.p1  ORF type:complete len:153 (+),score=34.48 TRINITY_DN1020_c0_g1_i1:99-557(+)
MAVAAGMAMGTALTTKTNNSMAVTIRPSFCRGQQWVPRKMQTRRMRRADRSGLRVYAKYGEKSIYFDLEDISNTTGAWDLYGSDAPSPYNPLQSKFFETFAAPFTKRGLLLKFLLLGGAATISYAATSATGDILPIKRGPQQPPQPGPRGKI